jgi:hypothetical protein
LQLLVGAHQFAHRLMAGIGDPDRGEFTGTVQFGQRHRVAPVGLDPIARTPGDQRGRNNRACMTKRGDLPVQAISCRPGFIAKRQPAMPFLQLRNQPGNPGSFDTRFTLLKTG